MRTVRSTSTSEGDLDQIMEQEEVNPALASYREVREALTSQKMNRGYYPKGKGNWSNSKGKGKGKQKIHVEQLSQAPPNPSSVPPNPAFWSL